MKLSPREDVPQIRFCEALFQIFHSRLRVRKLDHDVEQLIDAGLGVHLEKVVAQLLPEGGQQLQAVVIGNLKKKQISFFCFVFRGIL